MHSLIPFSSSLLYGLPSSPFYPFLPSPSLLQTYFTHHLPFLPPLFLKSVHPFVLSVLFSSRPVCRLVILLSLSSWLLPRSISPFTFISSDNLLSFLSVLSSFVLFFPIFQSFFYSFLSPFSFFPPLNVSC